MKYFVHYIAGNHRIREEVYANHPRQAQQIVQSRNPYARIINVTCT
jgi:hypothetical protein